MESRNKIYLINGNELLFALLNQDTEKWYSEIKLLKNLDNALGYITKLIEKYIELQEPQSKFIILIDKPIRTTNIHPAVEIRYVSSFQLTEEFTYEIKHNASKSNIVLVSNHKQFQSYSKYANINFIKASDFLDRLTDKLSERTRKELGDYYESPNSFLLKSQVVAKPIFDSYRLDELHIIDFLRNASINLLVSNINDELIDVSDTLFAIHFVGKNFPFTKASEYVKVRPIIYIGYTSNGGSIRRLISDDTSKSSIRQILGLLLRDNEIKHYEIISVPKVGFKFDDKSEWKLTDWIKKNLKIAFVRNLDRLSNINVRDSRRRVQLKNRIIRELSPVLNLNNNPGNPYSYELNQIYKKIKNSLQDLDSDSNLIFSARAPFKRDDLNLDRLQNQLNRLNDSFNNFETLSSNSQREILKLMSSYKNIRNIFQYHYSTESKSKERDLLDFISEKEEKTVKQEWERIIDEMAHSINTDVYAALSYLNQFLDNDKIKKASYNIQQIRDLSNLIMWFLKRNKLKLSGLIEPVSLDNVIKNQIETIKAGINTLRLTTSGHRDKILTLSVDIETQGEAIIQIDKDLISAIDLLFKDILRNALKNTDENNPKVRVLIKGTSDSILVDISNNLIISQKELDWFNNDIEDDELQMSKSSKVGLRIIKKWCKYLKIEYRIEIDTRRKETMFHLKIPKEVNVEESN